MAELTGSGADPVDVSVVIVSYNTRDRLRHCLEALLDSITLSVQVIVLDNASIDGSAELVAESFPEVLLIRSRTNLGFAAGVNRAARHAVGDHLLLLNPDAEIQPGAIEALLGAASRHPDAGPIGGRTVGPDGELDRRSCWALPSMWSLVCFGTGLSTGFRHSALFDPESLGRWPRDTERTVGAISGALLLIDRGLWTRLGGFDESYFMYSEDIDLALRALALRRPALVTPDATAVHVGGASSASRADKMILVMTGKAHYFRKNWSPGRRRWALAMLQSGVALRAALQRLSVRSSSGARMWVEVWRARATWLPGFAAGHAPPHPVDDPAARAG
jgi:GT2 family glycosyltransferase